jgi:hypothetical protein
VNNKGEITVGNRYYVTSMTPDKASPENLLQVSRVHWRIENEVHWTSDVLLREDARRTPLSKHPTAILWPCCVPWPGVFWPCCTQNLAFERLQRPMNGTIRTSQSGAMRGRRDMLHSLLQLLFVPLLDTTDFDLVDPA